MLWIVWRIEIAIDLRQWLVGFNYHAEIGLGLNVFLGPIRFSWLRED